MTLTQLSNEELLTGFDSLVGSERELVARTVAYLAEVEKRRLHLELAYSSLFDFCVRRLHLSEGEAYRRIVAARLSRQFPTIFGLIEDGSIHLSALVLLRDHLTDSNQTRLLAAASGKTKREVEALVAAEFPRPDSPSRIRKLPESRSECASTDALLLSLKPSSASERARIEPLSEARYQVQFTAGQALRDKLEHAKQLMSHANPSGDLAVLVERAVDLLIADCEKKKRGKTDRPRAARRSKPGHIPASVRRAVFERDGDRCTFVSESGERCPACDFLELDHIVPCAHGGADTVENLRVRCRNHNQHAAERVFGRAHIENRIEQRRAKSPDPFDQVFSALTTLGFSRRQTRSALESLRVDEMQPYSVDELLRSALAVLTP